MSRRVSLPAADELFRPTAHGGPHDDARDPRAGEQANDGGTGGATNEDGANGARRPSGRVYITSDELMDLEHARLLLRRSHGLAVDRGRVVREAISIALADFEINGDDSVIVQRLRDA